MMRLWFLIVALLVSPAAMAQEEAAPVAENAEPVAIEIKKQDIAPIEPFPEGYRSLFYTEKEHKALLDSIARKITPLSRGDNEEEITAEDQVIAVKEQGPPPPRILHLSGIVYTSPQDWTLWLNGKRVSPKEMLPAIKDLRVAKEFIDLKWLDATSGETVPVRLRPHQRFNIDSKTFMPGSAQ
jgi:hypothetical protein